MIARIIIPLILIVLLSDVYIDFHFLRRITSRIRRTAYRIFWFAQSMSVMAYALMLATEKNFAPACIDKLNWFLLLTGVWILPKFVFAVCSALGWGHCAYHKTKTNWGNYAGTVIGAVVAATTVYGYTWGFSQIQVHHVTFVSSELPEGFNGYEIVQFSDAHVGTYSGSKAHILAAAMDSINAQHPDMIVFTGDLQNMMPGEIAEKRDVLSRLHAKDGVFSILGNHDYAFYLDTDDTTRERICKEVKTQQHKLGWTLLCNENRIIHRGNDSIVVAGMEYEGKNKRCSNRGDIQKTMQGIDKRNSFVVMLQHDPTFWESDILTHSNAQLTLSGHTHAGQMKLFGWSPASLIYKYWDGLHYKGKRALNVSSGLGGFAPFRFWCPGEIVVIKLIRN